MESLIHEHSAYFSTGVTRSLEFRKQALKRLYDFIEKNEDLFLSALKQDLGKPAFEAIGAELEPLLSEILWAISNLDDWAQPQTKRSRLLSHNQFGTRAFVLPEPYGVCLVIGTWNYPFQLSLLPVVSAVAAGNSVILKPSEHAPTSAKLMQSCIQHVFETGHVSCVLGGAETAQDLLSHRFDKIFYTGSAAIGQKVMQAAAQHLTPVCLELGGKSPCVFDEKSSERKFLKRALWGKFLNAGQTCVAPDYCLVPRSRLEFFIEESKSILEEFYGKTPLESEDLAVIINESHLRRLAGLLKESKVIHGGDIDWKSRRISPSLIVEEERDAMIFQDEIFGPLLPFVPYDDFEEIFDWIRSFEKALVIYLFSSNQRKQEELMMRTSSGALVINEVMVQMAHLELPFGGVGQSGIGRYHGHYGFCEFSHEKAIQIRSPWVNLSLRYPPYKILPKWMRRFL